MVQFSDSMSIRAVAQEPPAAPVAAAVAAGPDRALVIPARPLQAVH
jgi:hypothetical protein